MGVVALFVVLALATTTAAASPGAPASTAPPAIQAVDGGQSGPLTDHCGPNETRVDLGDGLHDCIYNPPCDGTCTEVAMAVQIR